jgi:chlorophyllide a oxygenase
MEAVVNNMLLQDPQEVAKGKAAVATTVATDSPRQKKSQGLTVAGPVKKYSPALKNFWYPVAFAADVKSDTMVT